MSEFEERVAIVSGAGSVGLSARSGPGRRPTEPLVTLDTLIEVSMLSNIDIVKFD